MALIPRISSLYFDDEYRNELNYSINVMNQELNNVYIKLSKMYGNLPKSSLDEVAAARINAYGQAFATLGNRIDSTEIIANKALNEVQSKADKNELEDKLSQISFIPEAFPNLDVLKSTYPNGKPGLMVVADSGHKFIWTDGNWKDCGEYQSAGIADGSITRTKLANNSVGTDAVSLIPYSKVIDNYADVEGIINWNNSVKNIFISGNGVVFDSPKGDSGIIIPVKLDEDISNIKELYINFDYFLSAVDPGADAPMPDIYSYDPENNDFTFIQNIEYSSQYKHFQTKIGNELLTKYATGDTYYLLVAVHNEAKVAITQIFMNKDNNIKHLAEQMSDLSDGNVKVKDTSLIGSNNFSGGNVREWFWQNDDDIIITKDSIFGYFRSGARGLMISASEDIDLSKDIYITFYGRTSNNDSSSIILTKYDDLANHKFIEFCTIDQYGSNVKLKITPSMLNDLGITKPSEMFILVGGQQMSITIEDYSISNTPGAGNLASNLKYLNENSDDRNVQRIGMNDKTIFNAEEVKVDGLKYVTPQTTVKNKNCYLKTINIYSKNGGNKTFTVGTIDQHNLMVGASYFTLDVPKGYSSLDVENKKIVIGSGQHLFYDSTDEPLFKEQGDKPEFFNNLIQDYNHDSDDTNYKGNPFYFTKSLIPFSYEVIDRSANEVVNDISAKVEKVSADNDILMNFKDNLLIKSPSGKNFRLTVDNNGILGTTSLVPNKVRIFGNSLTNAGGGIGMAASDQYHDWYSIVTNYIKSQNKTVDINPRRNDANWESSTTSAERQAVFDNNLKQFLDPDTDLVIVQLGDNINTPEKERTWGTDAETLIRNIRNQCPNARVFWIYGWFTTDEKMEKLKTAVNNAGATLVDIIPYQGNNSQLGATRTGIDGSTWKITNPGEAMHPGDEGMKLIADKVISKLGF